MISIRWREWRDLIVQTATDWSADKAPRLGAALAFYTALSMAPLLVLLLRLTATIFGDDAARGEIERQGKYLLGEEGAKAVQAMIDNARRSPSGPIATVLGFGTLLFGASGVFGQLQDSLNTIWEVQPKPGRGISGFLRDRFLSFAMVMGTAFLLLVSLVISTMLSALERVAGTLTDHMEAVAYYGNMAASFLIVTGLFAAIFKVVPDVEIEWKDVWIGAVLTSILFAIGKSLLGLYLVRSSLASSYGVAGSLVVMLVWVYYSAQIVFFGAEFTQVYARRHGRAIQPSDNAVSVTQEQRAQEGMSAAESLEKVGSPAAIHG